MRTFNMMKYILGGILLNSVVACVPLDTEPYDRETDLSFWNKEGSALYALNACYPTLYSAEEVLYADAMTDNAYTKVQTGFNQSIGNGSYSTAYPYVESVWDSRYAGIRACNELINNINKVPGLSDELRNRYCAEAMVIRAFHYFELYSRFGDVPYFTNVITIEESQQLPRTSKAEVVTNILAELDQVIDNNYLPASYSSTEDKGRITKWAAMALKARILLFEGRWEELKAVTSTIMTQGGFSLFPNYAGLFEVANENNEEVILDLQYLSPDREQQIQYQFLPPTLKGYAQLAPLNELVQSYITDNGKAIDEAGANYDSSKPFEHRDPRLAATYILPGDNSSISNYTYTPFDPGSSDYVGKTGASRSGYMLKKFIDENDRSTGYGSLDFPLYRYAEVLLDYVECLVETGDWQNPDVETYINMIRHRAGLPAMDKSVYNTQEKVRELYRRERRVELCFENKRYDDIRRWGIGTETMSGPIYGAWNPNDEAFVLIETRACVFPKYDSWPLPQQEETANSNIKQPTGW